MNDLVERLLARDALAKEQGGDMMTYGEGDLLSREAAAEIVRLRKIEAAAKLYDAWERKYHDYPHDEDGCEAHQAILDAVRVF